MEIVDSKEFAEKIAKKVDVAFVGAFTAKDNAQFGIYESVADGNRVSGKFVAYIDEKAKNDVAVYRKDEGDAIIHNVIKKVDLQKFVTEERFPLFGPITGDNYGDYFNNGLDIVWFASSESDFKSSGKVIREVGKEFRSTNSFVWLDLEKFKDHAQGSLGVKEFPALVLQTKEGRYVYPANKFSDASKIIAFLKDALAGKIEKFLMSDEIPETNDELVKVIVGKTFKDMVLQANKNVLVEVYAPW